MEAVRTHTRTDRSASVDSRWWYGVAALPIASVLAFLVVGLATGVVVVSGALNSDVAGPVFGLLVLLGMLSVASVIAAGIALPVSLYFDGRAVTGASVDWQPDVTRYAVLGLLGALVHPLGIAVACYYLYRRHRYVGVPGATHRSERR